MIKGIHLTVLFLLGNGFGIGIRDASACCPLPFKSSSSISRITISVEEMIDSEGEAAIKSALKRLDGMVKCRASHRRGRVTCKFDSNRLSVQEIVDVINQNRL